MIRALSIAGMLCLLGGSGVLPLRAQNLPDAPASDVADPHSVDAGRSPKTTAGSRNSRTQDSGSQQPGKDAAGENTFPEAESKKAAAPADTRDASDNNHDDGDKKSPARKNNDKKDKTDQKMNAAEDNPFPEESSKAAAKAAGSAPESSSGDADNAGVSSSRKTGPGAPVDLPKEGEIAALPDPKRAAQDVQIGKYYLDSGNYKGAYPRLREASALSPEDPEIAFLLAESARKLNHLDEAVANYKLCLRLDPEGPKAKAAKRALGGFDKIASR